jgi:hypothetical protein
MFSYLENAVVDCGDFSAVKRDGGEWQMERNRSHAELENDFYRTTSKSEMLDSFRGQWEKEYSGNTRDGKLREDRKEFYIAGYIGFPALFEKDMAWLEKFSGKLSPADEAWVKNTRETIAKYHALYQKEIGGEKPVKIRAEEASEFALPFEKN